MNTRTLNVCTMDHNLHSSNDIAHLKSPKIKFWHLKHEEKWKSSTLKNPSEITYLIHFFIQMYTKWVSSSYRAPFDLQNNFISFCFIAFRLNRISSKLVREWLIRLIRYSYSIIRSRFLVLISNWILDNLCMYNNQWYVWLNGYNIWWRLNNAQPLQVFEFQEINRWKKKHHRPLVPDWCLHELLAD